MSGAYVTPGGQGIQSRPILAGRPADLQPARRLAGTGDVTQPAGAVTHRGQNRWIRDNLLQAGPAEFPATRCHGGSMTGPQHYLAAEECLEISRRSDETKPPPPMTNAPPPRTSGSSPARSGRGTDGADGRARPFRAPGRRSPMSFPALSEIMRGSQVRPRAAVPADGPGHGRARGDGRRVARGNGALPLVISQRALGPAWGSSGRRVSRRSA
jgi:hypothetical protein